MSAISEIYGLGDRAVARRSDPDTSHDAAASVAEQTKLQRLILWHLAASPKCDADLIVGVRGAAKLFGQWSDSGIRTRRKELVTMGKVKDSGERATLPTGRQSIVWCLAADHAR